MPFGNPKAFKVKDSESGHYRLRARIEIKMIVGQLGTGAIRTKVFKERGFSRIEIAPECRSLFREQNFTRIYAL